MKFQCGSENEQQTGCDIIHSEERPPSIFVICLKLFSLEKKKKRKRTRIVKIFHNVHKKEVRKGTCVGVIVLGCILFIIFSVYELCLCIENKNCSLIVNVG